MKVTVEDSPKTSVSMEDVTTKWEQGFNEGLDLHKKEVGAYLNKGYEPVGFSFIRMDNAWIFATVLYK